jgi:hypothetical protein
MLQKRKIRQDFIGQKNPPKNIFFKDFMLSSNSFSFTLDAEVWLTLITM